MNSNYYTEIITFVLRFLFGVVSVAVLSKNHLFWVLVGFNGLTAFLAYGDLGFIKSGTTFYNQSNEADKLKYFFPSILLASTIGTLLISFAIYFSYNPEVYFNDFNGEFNAAEFSFYLIIVAVLLPLRKVLEGILIADLRITIVNLLNIGLYLSQIIFLIIANKKDDLIFLFIKLQTAIYAILNLILVYFIIKQHQKKFFHLFKFNLKSLLITWKLNAVGIVVTIIWVFYFDLDRSLIAKFGEAEELATYGMLLIIPLTLRQLNGILFRQIPIIVNKTSLDLLALKSCVNEILKNNSVISLLLTGLSFEFIEFLVEQIFGWQYDVKIYLLGIGIFLNGFITTLCASVLTSQLAYKKLIIYTLINCVVFYLGILILGEFNTLNIFLSKTISSIVSIFISFFYLRELILHSILKQTFLIGILIFIKSILIITLLQYFEFLKIGILCLSITSVVFYIYYKKIQLI